jgi:release factor glutamine methyltransferase
LPDAAVAAYAQLRVRDAIARGAAALAAAGIDTPRLDAELLLAAARDVDRSRLVLDARQPLGSAAAQRFEALLARRLAREPVAYILGRKKFRRISLEVDQRVLIPRPETELLVEVGLGLAPGLRVADVGTGSGAVALALKDERPDLEVVGLDVDPGALAVARGNAARLGLDVRFVQSDLLDGGGYDAVLANLPYVAAGFDVAPEIARYEPASAVFAGEDGLDVIRRLVPLLRDVSQVALEIGFDQADAVAALLGGAGFASVTRRRDLTGVERVIVGRR